MIDWLSVEVEVTPFAGPFVSGLLQTVAHLKPPASGTARLRETPDTLHVQAQAAGGTSINQLPRNKLNQPGGRGRDHRRVWIPGQPGIRPAGAQPSELLRGSRRCRVPG